jgi:uncharacterized protein YjbI with pentapeptide repeats
MSFFGRSNRILVENALEKGTIENCQIAECDLSNLPVKNVQWKHTDIRDLHANDIFFQDTNMEGSSFFRSSFMRASFDKAVLVSMIFDGLTLIKSRWQDTWIKDTVMKNLCLQKSYFSRTRFIAVSLLDFEALNIKMDNCIFANSMFGINYGSGMNGFSGAVISNCIFYHCRFEGYPLRGANINSSVFIYCSGEIGDEIECTNVAGIGLRGKACRKPLQKMNEARRLLDQCASGGVEWRA